MLLNKRRVLFLLFVGIASLHIYGQEATLKGSISYADGNEEYCYNVLVYVLGEDTTLFGGQTFLTKEFVLKVPKGKPLLIDFTSMGYQSVNQTLMPIADKATVYPLQNIQFDVDLVALKEVIVVAKYPTVRMTADKLHIDVKNTTLSDAGDLMDMLKRTPGLIKSGADGIVVPGRGEPLIVLDGKEIKNKEILQSLKSNEIKSIEIDRNPSSAYSATVRAVVHIRTNRQLSDNVYLRFSGAVEANRRTSVRPSIQFKMKKGIETVN